ncbi:Transcriptional repressor [Venturia inaequalis]|nr:Transcriptional repressor [Venturia inaequalis]
MRSTWTPGDQTDIKKSDNSAQLARDSSIIHLSSPPPLLAVLCTAATWQEPTSFKSIAAYETPQSHLQAASRGKDAQLNHRDQGSEIQPIPKSPFTLNQPFGSSCISSVSNEPVAANNASKQSVRRKATHLQTVVLASKKD